MALKLSTSSDVVSQTNSAHEKTKPATSFPEVGLDKSDVFGSDKSGHIDVDRDKDEDANAKTTPAAEQSTDRQDDKSSTRSRLTSTSDRRDACHVAGSTTPPSRQSSLPYSCQEVSCSESQLRNDVTLADHVTPPLPPDGGYGWVIVFCGFMVNLLVDGMCYMGGMLYIELLEYFQQPKGKTQWVHTLVPAVYLLTGPFVGALVNKFGCRLITISGSLLATTFFIISSMAPSIEVMIFTYGIMIGIGFGFMYLPAVCFVSYYFDRRRALATGIAVCGSGIGTFIFPPFMNFLLSCYGWRGSLMILAGMALNCCIFGALMRPLVARSPKPKDPEALSSPKKRRKLQKQMEQQRSIIMEKIVEQKKRQRTISSGSLDGSVITKDNKLVKDPHLLRIILEMETQNRLAKNEITNESYPDLSGTRNTSAGKSEMVQDVRCRSAQSSMVDLATKRSLGVARSDRGSASGSGNRVDVTPTLSAADIERKRKDMARIMYRQDVFYTGSVTSIAEYKSNPDLDQYTQSVISVPISFSDGGSGSCAPFTNILNQMFDLSLFKSVTFIVLIGNAFLSFLGFFVPFMFIPDLAKILGASGSEAALLISIIGICNTFSRLAAGWLADRSWADCLVIQNVALIAGGIATALVPLLVNYALLALYCCVFGICMAMFIALRSIVTAEMMGVQKLNSAFGLTIFFQGVAGTAGSPLAGTIFDATGSYAVSFIIAGSFIALSGVICLPLRRIAAWENARLSGDDVKYSVVAVDDAVPQQSEADISTKEVQFVSNNWLRDVTKGNC